MAYVADLNAANESLAQLKAMRAQEEASTIDRVERLRRFVRDDDVLRDRERAEWRAFSMRVAPIEREIGVLASLIAQVKSLEAPAPVILPQGSTDR